MSAAESVRQLESGLTHHRAGRIDQAVAAYRAALDADPDNVDALNLLGVLALEGGEAGLAVTLGERAAALAPDFAPARVNLGNALQAAGRIEDAVAAFEAALALAPDLPVAHANLASALTDAGRAEAALEHAERALTLEPGNAQALVNRGRACQALGRPNDALAAFQAAVRARPGDARAQYGLGTLLADMGDDEGAVTRLDTACRLAPRDRDALYNLGNAQLRLNRFDAAKDAFRRALALDPADTDAATNLAAALQAAGDLDLAAESFQNLLDARPGLAEAHWNLAVALIQKGDWARAWPHYEHRFDDPAFTSPKRAFDAPRWDGGDLSGRRILVHAEQGLGDTLMAARYVKPLAEHGADVAVMAHRPLVALFERMEGVAAAVPFDADPGPIDAHVPMLSLPGLFETTPETVPWTGPYVGPPGDRAAPDVLTRAAGFKVGVAWAGSPTHARDRHRSVAARRFADWVEIPGASLFSLQVGDAAGAVPDGIQDLAPGIRDFADTAACIGALDAVVSVDTALVHLAGAMGKPVLILAARPRSYFWMWGRAATPWYPTAEIVEQPEPGAWDPVFAAARRRVADAATGAPFLSHNHR